MTTILRSAPRLLLILGLMLPLTGCSFVTVPSPPSPVALDADEPPDCKDESVAPLLDFISAGIGAVIMADALTATCIEGVNCADYALNASLGAAWMIGSTIAGFKGRSHIAECREARQKWREAQAGFPTSPVSPIDKFNPSSAKKMNLH